MSDSSEEYVHIFRSLEVYPRIYYYHRRYRDLLARFNRITGALPKCFKDDKLICQLDELNHEFQGGIKVLVIGHDLNDLDLVFNADSKSQNTHQYRIEIAVFHLSQKLLNGEEYQVTKAKFKAFIRDAAKAEHKTFVFVKCDQIMNTEETTRFQDDMLVAFGDELEKYFAKQDRIFIFPSSQDTRTTISDELERYLAIGFLKIDSHVKLYESVNMSDVHSESCNVFKNDSIAFSVNAFLRNARAYVEVNIDTDEKEKSCSVIFNHLLKSLGHIIRCSLAYPFARKFGLKVGICNSVLCEVQFEEALLDAISENTRYHMKRMANYVYEEISTGTGYSKHTKTFDFLFYSISSDVEPVIENVEKKLHSMRRLSSVFRKMAFETQGYLKQLECVPSVENRWARMSKELRKEILSIEGVYGLGTLYGQLEIHVDKDKVLASSPVEDKHDDKNRNNTDVIYLKTVSDSSKQNNECLARLTAEIASRMQWHHFTEQYAVKYIEKKAIEMVAIFEPGDRLFERHKERFGTLGGFIVTNDGKVHGLTCAHVVGVKEKIFIDKSGPEPFSRCPKVVNRKNCVHTHIDIAALEVIPLKQNICKQTLQECNECITKANLSEDHPESIVGSPVFKYGAASGSTKGFVVSVDYSIFGPDTEDYIVVIDTQSDLPTDFRESFDPITSVNDQSPSQTLDEENKSSLVYPDDRILEQAPDNRECISIDTDTLDETNEVVGVAEGHSAVYTGRTSSIIYARNATNTIQSMECTSSNTDETDHGKYRLGKTIVYVRNTICNQTHNSKEGGYTDEVFAKKGDSGSIVCMHEATRDGIKHKALSMLSAGDFKIGGDESLKCLSFKLNVGLKMLKQQYGLDL